MKRFGLSCFAVCGLVWAGLGAGVAAGQTGTKADSSAALRNDHQKRPMTFADMMAMKRVSDPQISPTGEWVLFSVTDVDLGKNTKANHLWVVGLGGGGGTKTNAGILDRKSTRLNSSHLGSS